MRILVVEDEPQLGSTIAQALREAGYATDVAKDGEEGLSLGLTFAFDLVVLDLLLPGRHGLSVLRELRKKKPALPILVLTALDQVEEKVDGLEKGADDYMTKPFALTELLARVRALLRRGKADLPGAVVKVGDLVVDLAQQRVTRRGEPVKLTPREYALLVFFLNRRGSVLSRTEIGEHVVDRDFEATSNLIDVSIAGLRSKLGDPQLIHTVRGAGYRFEEPEGS
ncbi:MAG TPA: response regulator transcription factor [Planctomycetota bacterium]|nr:response regulator transcription factor [Planctomycetota bacterium]